MTTSRLISSAAVATIASLAIAGPAGAETQPYPMVKKAYGKRYCEMAVAFPDGPGLKVDVYNSFALNTCPESGWKAATSSESLAAAKAALGAFAVVTNGPRWWAFDEIGGVLDPAVVSFGGLMMNKAAVLNFATGAPPPAFTPLTVQRTSTWVYAKGTYLRVLTAPDGNRYVMQAWTTQVSRKVTASALNGLAGGSRPLIKLPAGWKYRAYKATKRTVIVAPGTMTILQDNLKNTYSLIS